MNHIEFEELKGFMPRHEGNALLRWAKKFSKIGPILEIGTYCGKSALYMSLGALENHQLVFSIDHHLGSEEHQLNEEYFDEETYDFSKNRVDTFPLLIKNINKFKARNIVPIISHPSKVASKWSSKLGMVFIDGGHSIDAAMTDYISWKSKILSNGALVIHDIFENPEDGGQAPYEIYKRALGDGFELYEKEDTIVCLIKS